MYNEANAAPAGAAPQVDAAAQVDAAISPEAEVAALEAEVAAAKEAPKSNKKKFDLKVDGKLESLELDLDDVEEVSKHLQMSKVAQKRMAEMAETKKSLAQFFDQLQKDPMSVLSDPRLNISPEARRAMAERIINGEIEELQKTPEQREKEKLQKELEALKKQHEDDKTKRETEEFQRLQEAAAVQYDRDISDAIDKVKLPKTAYTVKQMAEVMMFALQNGIDLSPQDVAPMIKKRTMADFNELLGSLADDDFEEFLGKDNIGRIRKRSLAKLKAASKTAPATSESVKSSTQSAKPKEEAKGEKKLNMKDVFSKW